MKIVFFNTSAPDQQRVREALSAHEVSFVTGTITENLAIVASADIISVFIDTTVDEGALTQLPNVKLIATRSTGYDHIALDAATRQGISVATVPTYGVRTVAEFAFALLLTLTRRLRAGSYSDAAVAFEGVDLYKKTIGIVGTGNIGKNVARIAQGFGMRILLCDMYPNTSFASEVGGTYVDMKTLVAQSDVVTLHMPYTPDTHHLVNASLLSQFKHGSILINTARGGIVDTRALIDALKNGTLYGAGLDVVEEERQKNSPLISELESCANVIRTPHIAYGTHEARSEILETTIENILSYTAGSPRNIVTKPV